MAAEHPRDTPPPALLISELQWWQTEDELRGWVVEANVPIAELRELAFAEHKVNGKAKGQVYLEFSGLEMATGMKTFLEGRGVTVSYWGGGNPFRTLPKDPAVRKAESARGRGRGRGNYNNYNNGGHGGHGGHGVHGNHGGMMPNMMMGGMNNMNNMNGMGMMMGGGFPMNFSAPFYPQMPQMMPNHGQDWSGGMPGGDNPHGTKRPRPE